VTRPAGDYRRACIAALAAGPGTCRAVAERASLSVRVAQYTLHNLCVAEVVTKPEPIRVDGIKRPVPVYQLQAPPEPEPSVKLAQALSVWWLEY
jgi:hypothetical protein